MKKLYNLELNFVAKYDKTIIVPVIVFANYIGLRGQYLNPERNECYDSDGHSYDMNKGVIVVNPTLANDNEIMNAIAHEWRHHWQYHRGIKYDGISDNTYTWDGYINYFKKSKAELDALLFARKYAKTESDEYVVETLDVINK